MIFMMMMMMITFDEFDIDFHDDNYYDEFACSVIKFIMHFEPPECPGLHV
jgi:hypothetical protein